MNAGHNQTVIARFIHVHKSTIVGRGRRHAIVSLTDPKSRLARLKKVKRMANVVIELPKTLSEKTYTITAHKRKEFV